MAGRKWTDTAEEPESTLAFVTYSGPSKKNNKQTQRLIHRHAMKEIGKTRRRPKVPKEVELDLSPLYAQEPTSKQSQETFQKPWWSGVRWTEIDGLDPFNQYPASLDADGRVLLSSSECLDMTQQQNASCHDLYLPSFGILT